jgi:prephenate dehydrogenase
MRTPWVGIVGLGQMGGSLAAALTRRRLARVVGFTRRRETALRARRMGIVATATTDLEGVAAMEFVVLATPMRTLIRQIPQVLRLLRPGALLTDVGSTKEEIRRTCLGLMPEVAVVGGHPMAGNENAGLDGCDADLYVGRPWVLIPFHTSVPWAHRAATRLEGLVRGVGARPVWMKSSMEHDLAVARISHVPYLLAYALMEQPEAALRLAGNSFRDATRVALSDPDMVLDFLLTNRAPARRAARELGRRFLELSVLVGRSDERALRKRLVEARARRARLQGRKGF